MGVEALGLATSGAAVSWTTLLEEVELEVGEGVGFVGSPAAVRLTMPAGEAGGTLFGLATGVSAGTLEEVVEVAGG